MQHDAYIAIGSNQGNRELNLLRAIAELGRLPGCRVTGLSAFYETSPVGMSSQTQFYNAVVRLATSLPPRQLLDKLLAIETDLFGRIRTGQWESRSLDLDLLLYDDLVIIEEELIVPHPRLAERRFVLQPLHDIASDLIHPQLGHSVAELLAALNTDEVVRKV